MKHKHYDVIIAWAEGKEIRGRELNRYPLREWITFGKDEGPTWWDGWEYEIVPEKLVVHVNTYTNGVSPDVFLTKDEAVSASKICTGIDRTAVKMVEV